MSYADFTFRDNNSIKRWLQYRRLFTAVDLYSPMRMSGDVVCDFGGGNGELCKLLATRYADSRIICYEPTPSLLKEARDNLRGFDATEFTNSVSDIRSGSVDAVFCLEVFEHLPPRETVDAMFEIHRILKPEGTLIAGVPVEVGLPALYKGLFRMSRRFGAFDASFKNVALSTLGRPPTDRPTSEIAPGLAFYREHVGFDYRQFVRALRARFALRQTATSPFALPGPWLMPEFYVVAAKSGA